MFYQRSHLFNNFLCSPEVCSLRDQKVVDYLDVLSKNGFIASNPKHGMFNVLPTIPGPLPRLSLQRWRLQESIQRSSSPWSSPLHMLQKSDRSWRPCGHYRRLNTDTVPDRFPLPSVSLFSPRISGSKVFSKLDLQEGYYQVPMRDPMRSYER